MSAPKSVPSISVTYAQRGTSAKSNELGMRPMQERAYQKRGEQYLLIKSPPASGKSRALMFIALDKLQNQGLKQAIIVVPEKTIGASFHNEPLGKFGFWADWTVEPKWNLCNAPGSDGGKVNSVKAFLDGDSKVLVCTHATFRFAVDKFGVEAFDYRLLAVDEFHHVSANPDNKLGAHLGDFIARDKVHIVAMTGSYFRGDAEAVLHPEDEGKFDTVTYTYYEQLNGYEFRPKRSDNGPTEGYDYGEDGYKVNEPNVGFNEATGKIQMEINGLIEPKSEKAQRICQDDLNEVITAFVQDKDAVGRGLFDEELVPEELTQVRMGKIIKDKYPELDDSDREAVRQHAVAALNLIQKAKQNIVDSGEGIPTANTALIDGVRRYAMDVKTLDIDLIDQINPFGEAYAILSKSMNEERLRRIKEIIGARNVSLNLEEARELAKRALKFKQEKGRLPSLTAADPWEKRMAEGVAFLQRKAKEEQADA